METPFIKLFHTPNSGYFYDVGKNEIIRIPKNVYLHLLEVMDGSTSLEQSDDEDVLEMIKSFKELGYLSSKRPHIIQHSATSMVPLLLNRCIDKITLQLTQDCNFRCKYCIYSEEKNLKQRSHMKKTMTFETAKKAILFYRDHAVDSIMYNVGFYGGEPLLEWPLLKEVVLFAEKELMGKLLTFSITTNASLLTESVVEFLEKHNISVLVSFDGVKSVNDKNRVFQNGMGTSDVVLKNIKMIKERHPQLYENLRISSVVSPEICISEFNKYPNDFDGIPLSNYTVSLEDNTEHDTTIPFELYRAMEKEAFLAYLAEAELYSLPLSPYGFGQLENIRNSMRLMKHSSGIQRIMAPGGPCLPGKSRLFVTVDGMLYPCERVNEVNTYCIGNVEHGFNYEKAAQMLNIGSISEGECSNCWAIRHCTMCAKFFDFTLRNARQEKIRFCASIQNRVSNKMRAMILLSEINTFYHNDLE